MIRVATLADVPDLVQLGARFLSSSVYAAHFPVNPAQMAELATHLITTGDGAIFVSAVNGDAPTGMIAALCYPHAWSGTRVCGELALFVNPEARGSAGARLVKTAEHWAQEHGAAQSHLVSPAGEERVEALYAVLGYTPLERGWVRAL
jgi:GNAT superfamily N-acetyltransferase